MRDQPPPSLLITPDRRRRLSQLFAEARRLAAEPKASGRKVHELLAECVQGDPGNVLYWDALLLHLRSRPPGSWLGSQVAAWFGDWFGKRRQPLNFGSESTSTGAESSVLSAPSSVLARSPGVLWGSAEDSSVYCQLAAAAGDCEFEEVELRLLTEARRLAPDDPETLRQLARALSRQGQFEEAVGPWHAVAALLGGDSEATAAIEDLRFAPPAVDEQSLVAAQAVRGADQALLVQRQELRLSQSLERVAVARRRAEHDAHPRAQRLVERLEDDHRRLEIEMYAMRAEQYPTDSAIRVELGRKLKQAGNYSGAIGVLEEAVRLRAEDAAGWIELGECRQRLRQFDEALACYQRAVQAEGGGGEELLLARYRLGVLAAAMGQGEEARHQFEAILVVQAGYKDVTERLEALKR